jgi:hypothetical protein
VTECGSLPGGRAGTPKSLRGKRDQQQHLTHAHAHTQHCCCTGRTNSWPLCTVCLLLRMVSGIIQGRVSTRRHTTPLFFTSELSLYHYRIRQKHIKGCIQRINNYNAGTKVQSRAAPEVCMARFSMLMISSSSEMADDCVQVQHTRDAFFARGAQSLQKILPHFLQWCRLRNKENATLHMLQFGASASGCHQPCFSERDPVTEFGDSAVAAQIRKSVRRRNYS